MKKLVLLFTGLLIGLTTVTAAEKFDSELQGEDLITNFYNHYTQPIEFAERGVEFLIFPDGTFDFNTHSDNNHYDNGNDNGYYRRTNTRSHSINTTHGAPGTRVQYSTPRNRGTLITHDANGKVRRIGNVFVNYNRIGQVKRLGSVYMQYNRKGLVTQVGGLKLKYDRRGRLIKTIGQVNRSNPNYGYSNNSPQQNNDWNNDNDHYYYKKDGKVVKQKKLKTLKPKK